MSRFREPYEAVSQRHEDALRQAREALTATVRHQQGWREQRPRWNRRITALLEWLWRDQLGLRPLPRFWRQLPALPRQRYDRRLRRLRRRQLRPHGKKIQRLRGMATESWPARWLRLKIALLRFGRALRSRPGWTLVLFLVAVLLALRFLAPSLFEDLLARMTFEMLGQ